MSFEREKLVVDRTVLVTVRRSVRPNQKFEVRSITTKCKGIFVAIGNFFFVVWISISTTFVAILGITWKIGCFSSTVSYQYAWVGGMRSIHIYFGSSTMPDCGNCRLSKSPSSISCEIELPSESLAMHILYHYHIYKPAFFFGGMKTQTHRIERLWWQLCRLDGLG